MTNLIFRESSMMHEYSTAIRSGSHTLPSRQLISDLRTNCSALKILEIGDDHRSPAGLLEETPSTWPPLLQLQTLRFVRTTHKAINTLLTRLNAPNLKVVEVVGNSIYSDQTAVIPYTEPPTIKLAAGVNWRLRFKDSTPQELLDALERIKILPPPVVEIDLMGLISRGTLNDVFGNPDVSPEGENPLSPSERLQQHLKTGWERILDRLPSVIWVIEQCQANDVATRCHPPAQSQARKSPPQSCLANKNDQLEVLPFMDSLPAEILSTMLVQALPIFVPEFLYDTDPGFAQARVCSVCKRWNNVALSTPEFWSQITISSTVWRHDVMKRRLKSSQQSKLAVHMQLILLAVDPELSESFREVHSLLVGAIGRWETFSVLGYAVDPQDLAFWIPLVLPCVEDIYFDVSQWDEAGVGVITAPSLSRCVSNNEKNLVFRECNVLREYSTATSNFGHPGIRILPWYQLVYDLHTNCSNLRVIEIRDDGSSSTGPESPEETSLPWPPLHRLRILRFTRARFKTIDTFMRNLKAPELEVVELTGLSLNNDDETVETADLQLPTVNLPREINWRLRFKDTLLQEICGALERMEYQLSVVVELDLMGLVPYDTVIAHLSELSGLQAGTIPISTFLDQNQHLEIDWKWIVNRLPAGISVIRREVEGWIPMTPNRPPSLDETMEHIITATARRLE
ncbi:hypothetical protein FRC01_004870 [Tulasnella sp. 417]|nr:hypothetical protein FRC01_004870 [Tulasnella sp. 417]